MSLKLESYFCNFFGDVYNNFAFLFIAMCLLSSLSPPVNAIQIFPANRLHFYSINDYKFGGTITNINCDLTVLSSFTHQPRNCILLHLSDVSSEFLDNFNNQKITGLILILPKDNYKSDHLNKMKEIESYFMSREIHFPVYFVNDTSPVRELYQRVLENSEKAKDNKLFASLFGINYRTEVYIDNSHSTYTVSKSSSKTYYDKPMSSDNLQINNAEGFLRPFDPSLKTIVLSASYDTFGFIENFSKGYESNTSGTVFLMEVLRVLSTFFSNPDYTSLYNVVFLFTDGGKYNFYGSEKWISSKSLNSDGLALVDSIAQVICIEAIVKSYSDKNLKMHVSKLPSPEQFSHTFIQLLKDFKDVDVIHKKIQLGKETLDWEHERYSIHRIPAMTLSTWPSVEKTELRQSILDGITLTDEDVERDSKFMAESVRAFSEAMIRMLANKTNSTQFPSIVQEDWATGASVAQLLKWTMKQPRDTNSFKYIDTSKLDKKVNSAKFVNSLSDYMTKSGLVNIKVTSHPWKMPVKKQSSFIKQREQPAKEEFLDKNDPSKLLARFTKPIDVIFNVPGDGYLLRVLKVHTSFFDMFISCCIIGYLIVLYYSIMFIVPAVSCLFEKIINGKKEKAI